MIVMDLAHLVGECFVKCLLKNVRKLNLDSRIYLELEIFTLFWTLEHRCTGFSRL